MKIGILTLSHGEKFKNDIKYGRQTLVDYCVKHNYELIEDEEIVEEHQREIQWTKILLIQKYLNSVYDYLVWIDADTVILNPDKTIEDFIERLMNGKYIMYSKDFGNWVNNGVIFVKNVPESREYFKEVWEHTDQICREQGSMDYLYRINWNNCQSYMQITEDPKEYNPVWYEYQYGQFLMHFPGCGEPKRPKNALLKMMDMFSPLKLCGDNEHQLDTEESYQERLRWLREDAENDLREKRQLCIQQGWKYLPIEVDLYFIHWFPFCSGGLCDRILGLASSVCIARLTGRKLLIKWDHAELSNAFKIKPEYNWYENSVKYKYVNISNFQALDYFQKVNFQKEWGNQNIMMWSNVNTFNSCITNQHIKHLLPVDYIRAYSEAIQFIFNEIFVIEPEVLSKVNHYDIGLHIRTGDDQISDKQCQEKYRGYIMNIFEKVKNIKEEKIFITTDCDLVYEIARDYLPKFHYNKGEVIHTSNEDGVKNRDATQKVLVDFLTLCKCSKGLYLGWNSNFSRIASLYNIDRKFICYEYENDQNVVKDFGLDLLFEYFSWGKYN